MVILRGSLLGPEQFNTLGGDMGTLSKFAKTLNGLVWPMC